MNNYKKLLGLLWIIITVHQGLFTTTTARKVTAEELEVNL